MRGRWPWGYGSVLSIIIIITDWTQAFLAYTAALVSEHPSATLELLAYSLRIIKASQQYDGLYWRTYDTHFRINAAASGNRQWSRLDPDLYTRFFTGRAKPAVACSVCDSIAHYEQKCHLKSGPRKAPIGGAPHSKRRPWPADICAEFNSKGVCSFGNRCKYRHCCGECAGEHTARSCPSKSA